MIKTEFMAICNERADAIRNQRRAYAYSLSVEVDREMKRARRKEVIKELVISTICIIGLVLFLNAFIDYANESYAGTTENTSTEVCTVTEINEDLVTVHHKGSFYSFYGNGYKVGDSIVCQFTSEMEIVNVLK